MSKSATDLSPVFPRDVQNLAARRPDAGQMRRTDEPCLAHDTLHHPVRPVTGRSVGTVGDGYIVRSQRRQPLDGLPKPVFHGFGAGREELE